MSGPDAGSAQWPAQAHQREGLPLPAELNVVGYLARKPEGADHQ